MAKAEFHEVLNIGKDKLLAAITAYENYPQFVEGCTAVQVEQRGNGTAKVRYQVHVMSQEVNYTLDHQEHLAQGRVEWSLVDSNFFRKNSGHWEIKDAGPGKSDVLYALEVEFKVPVPGFILNRLVKGSLPGMVRNFEEQAKKTS